MEQGTRNLERATSAPVAHGSGQGSALYVINLCASMAPIAQDKPVPGFENYRVYQVSRKEDGRIRYRLRLGFFADEAEAETALALIREHYPTAFAASLCDEDQRHTRGYAASAAPSRPVAVATTPRVAATQKATPAAAQSSASKAAPPSATSKQPPVAGESPKAAPRKQNPVVEVEIELTPRPIATTASTSVAAPPAATSQPAVVPTKAAATKPAAPEAAKPVEQKLELTLAAEPTAVAPNAPAKTATNEPFHVGKGVEIPASVLSLSLEPTPAAQTRAEQPKTPAANTTAVTPTTPKAAPANTISSKPVASKAAAAAPGPKSSPAAKTAPAKPAAQPPSAVLDLDARLPDLDSTQTIRALTAAELDDESQPKWFAVQLAVSEQAINLDTMPQLDIFAAYSLYSVATAGSGKILHHMRIGFFKEQMSAEAVCGYLKTFFANPTALRVSVAEYTRFSEGSKRVAPATPKGKIIDISAARDRSPPKEIPMVTQEVVNPATTGRFPKPNIDSTGVHKRPAAPPAKTPQPASAAKSAARTQSSTSSSGKHRTLEQALLEEAREIELSESAIRKLPKNSSLLSKLFGKK